MCLAVRPMDPAERQVEFQGPRNFRDLGGYRSVRGGTTRWGRVFRSDALHHLTAADHVVYEKLGVRVVYDLRGAVEREQHPNPFADRHLPLQGPQSSDDRPDFSGMQLEVHGEQMLHRQYLEMLSGAGPLFGRLFSGLADPEELPAVFHCAAGKDRTGLTAALLLTWLGVARETVLDDYELTSSLRSIDHEASLVARLLSLGMAQPAIAGLLSSPRWAMGDALDVLDRDYGGIESYLRGPAGMEVETMHGLRRGLLAPAREAAGSQPSSRPR